MSCTIYPLSKSSDRRLVKSAPMLNDNNYQRDAILPPSSSPSDFDPWDFDEDNEISQRMYLLSQTVTDCLSSLLSDATALRQIASFQKCCQETIFTATGSDDNPSTVQTTTKATSQDALLLEDAMIQRLYRLDRAVRSLEGKFDVLRDIVSSEQKALQDMELVAQEADDRQQYLSALQNLHQRRQSEQDHRRQKQQDLQARLERIRSKARATPSPPPPPVPPLPAAVVLADETSNKRQGRPSMLRQPSPSRRRQADSPTCGSDTPSFGCEIIASANSWRGEGETSPDAETVVDSTTTTIPGDSQDQNQRISEELLVVENQGGSTCGEPVLEGIDSIDTSNHGAKDPRCHETATNSSNTFCTIDHKTTNSSAKTDGMEHTTIVPRSSFPMRASARHSRPPPYPLLRSHSPPVTARHGTTTKAPLRVAIIAPSSTASLASTGSTNGSIAPPTVFRVSRTEFEHIPRTIRGRISLPVVNDALRNILQAIVERRRKARHHAAKLVSSSAYRGGPLPHNSLTAADHQPLPAEQFWIREQELRQSCSFFRSGERTARTILLILRHLHRLRQVPGKNGDIVYILP